MNRVVQIILTVLFPAVFSSAGLDSSWFQDQDQDQKPARAGGRDTGSPSASSRPEVPAAGHFLRQIEPQFDSLNLEFVFGFKGAAPAFAMESGKYGGMFVVTLMLKDCDFAGEGAELIERPVLFMEMQREIIQDTQMIVIHLYLEESYIPRAYLFDGRLHVQFKAYPGPETLWPFEVERVAFLSSDPFNLSVRVDLDEMPGHSKAFLTRNGRKVVLVMYHTVMDTNRIQDPGVPFIRGFDKMYFVSRSGASYSVLLFKSDGDLSFASREDNNRIYINLKRKAALVDPSWFR